MTNDVEKRWSDPKSFRAAATYVFAVLVISAVAMVVYSLSESKPLFVALLVPGVLFVGGVGAMVKTYVVWRARRVWIYWQGAGWMLLLLFVFCLTVPISGIR